MSKKDVIERLTTTGVIPVVRAQSADEAESALILRTLQRHGHNRLRTAAELGISRMTLYKKLHKYGLIGGNPDDRPSG